MYYEYVRVTESGELERSKLDDLQGKVTGRRVYNLKSWFDEHPEERKRLGWIKYLHPSAEDEGIEYDKQTQILMKNPVMVDKWTIKDELYVVDKSEEYLLFEEMQGLSWGDSGMFDTIGGITFVEGVV